MKTFCERQRAFENKFKYDQDKMFEINSRRAKLIGLWVAEKLNLPNAEDYAMELVEIDLDEPAHAALISKIQEDFKNHKKSVSLHRIEKEMLTQLENARREIMEN